MFTPPGDCPVCGTDVHAAARACPECGADDRSGWRDVEFAEEAFDYKEFLAEEFGQKKPRGLNPVWWLTALVILLGFLWAIVQGRF